jgi:hypothetical protein
MANKKATFLSGPVGHRSPPPVTFCVCRTEEKRAAAKEMKFSNEKLENPLAHPFEDAASLRHDRQKLQVRQEVG